MNSFRFYVMECSATFEKKQRTMENQIKFYENKLAFEMDPSDLFEALNNGEKIIALDARKPFGFETEHIPNAINIPHREMNLETTQHLDKDVLYVTYCDGIGCNASTKGALNMARLRFKVKELIGGLEWWKLDGYATEGIKGNKGGLKMECAC
ncbi:rhodanese-like domain-containing protein [Flavobacterium limi]